MTYGKSQYSVWWKGCYDFNLPRATPHYAALAILFVAACAHEGGAAWYLIHGLTHPDDVPAEPFSLQGATRTIGSGKLRFDQILAIEGRPFTAYRQFIEAVHSRHPGDRLRITLSAPSGQAFERGVRIPSERTDSFTAGNISVSLILNLFIPVLAIVLGFGVVFIRPRDLNAWLLLFLLLGFSEMARRGGWYGPWPELTIGWESLWAPAWPIFMLLFGIHFPTRLSLDRRHPWLKFVLIVPTAVAGLAFCAILLVWWSDINAALLWRPLLMRLYMGNLILTSLGICGFFTCLGFKTHLEPTADGRRRLRILSMGASISLAPIFLAVLDSLFTGRDVFDGVPWPLTVAALLVLGLFPVTLAYVIVVQKAMDLSFVIRRSLQYGVARVALYGGRAALIGLAIYVFNAARGARTLELASVGVGLLVLRRGATEGASKWVDRKFFREAYSAEKVLSELATEVGRYVEIKPLLEKVGNRISDTLHVPEITVLLREGNVFVSRYSTVRGELMTIPAEGHIAGNAEKGKALEIYLDRPPLWLKSLDTVELQSLASMNTQLLLPLIAQGQLTGMMSLGPKLSELPYTETDIRLLEAVASQMGLALENSRLVISLALEAAERQRANTELDIAREVQERLFPQTLPNVPGLDCAGYCRPARGVGGDYYDFLQLADGTIGIAIGDVSGKGIAAALLMASLQASLRGQAMAGVHDLAALMNNVNHLVFAASTSNRYATFFYGEYDTVSRRLSFVNAGHNPPVILRGSEVVRLEAGGPVVGLLPLACYEQAECALAPGDIFVGFTDGISEAMNDRDEEWEEEGFIASARGCSKLSATRMIEAIFKGADTFTGTAKQYDDMTLLIMKLS